MKPIVLAFLLSAGLLAAPASDAQAINRLEREGTIGLGIGGSYGTVTGTSRFGLDFAEGPGVALEIRYVLGPNWSLGFFFQNQRYNAVPSAPRDRDGRGVDRAVMTGFVGEVYYYRNRGLDSAPYLVAGLGIYRPEVHYDDETVAFPEENLVLVGGGGVELFIKENWGLDLNARAVGYFGDGVSTEEELNDIPVDGKFSVGLQAQAGLIYYLLR